jgi:hypothetical protein
MKSQTSPLSGTQSLQQEGILFQEAAAHFVDSIDMEILKDSPHDRRHIKDILLALLFLGYHGVSYRRLHSYLVRLRQMGVLQSVPSKNTLNRFVLNPIHTPILERLIGETAAAFASMESIGIFDSTWVGIGAYTASSHIKNTLKSKTNNNYLRTRKLHVCVLRNSRIIASAAATHGSANDSPLFSTLLTRVSENGFTLTEVLADKAYSAKDNYLLCQRLNIQNAFLDFKSNATVTRRSKSAIYRRQLLLKMNNPQEWKEHYRYRPIVESVFSSIKRKFRNYVASHQGVSQDNELLLRALAYNLTIVGRYFFSV